jgi:hypothetical protein
MSDTGEGMIALDAMLAKLGKLAQSGVEGAARACTPHVQAEAKRTAAAGTDPYGEPWHARKDGQRAIPEAASAVTCVARGNIIQIRVVRGAAIQNFLSEKNRRQVIPRSDRPLPEGIVGALNRGLREFFAEAMR